MRLVHLIVSLLILLASYLLDLFFNDIIFFLASVLRDILGCNVAYSTSLTTFASSVTNYFPFDSSSPRTSSITCVGEGPSTMSDSPSSIIRGLIISLSSSSSIARGVGSRTCNGMVASSTICERNGEAQLAYDSRYQKKNF